jgi:hypothetical protein
VDGKLFGQVILQKFLTLDLKQNMTLLQVTKIFLLKVYLLKAFNEGRLATSKICQPSIMLNFPEYGKKKLKKKNLFSKKLVQIKKNCYFCTR